LLPLRDNSTAQYARGGWYIFSGTKINIGATGTRECSHVTRARRSLLFPGESHEIKDPSILLSFNMAAFANKWE
jgi:hypothetical protein